MDKKFHQKLRRPNLLLIGCGDIGTRMLPWLTARFRVFAMLRDASRCAQIRHQGAIPLLADLDQLADLRRIAPLAAAANYVLHLAPPQAHGELDLRTRRLCRILPAGAKIVYVSTSGVYGDCAGARITETQPTQPQNARAIRRVDAEQVLRGFAKRTGARLSIVRVPGIYAAERLPIARLEKALPALLPEEDVYTNHIHAEDLARICALALFRGKPQRVYHAVDDSELKMGDYFDAVAKAFHLPPPARLPRSEISQHLSPAMLSFMNESRLLDNQRIKHELGVRLRYADVDAGIAAAVAGLAV